MQAQDVVVVGRIGAPYGVRGWVRVTSYTDPAANLVHYQPWLVETDGGWRNLHPDEIKPHKQGYVARFSDVNDRDEAARLTGKQVAVARAQLPALEQGEYYWSDLEGLAVWNGDRRLGVVRYLLDTGADPVLVVQNDDAGGGSETLIPFVNQYIGRVDLEAGQIDVDWVDWDEAD